MNLYLIEPYNPYVKTPKKKHWMEIAEEEAMYHRLVSELKNASNPAPSPDVAQSTAAGPSAGTGGGGHPELAYFHPSPIVGTYTVSQQTGPAPLTVVFTNPSSRYIYVNWDFGDGTTGVGSTVSHTFATTGSYFVSVTASIGPPIIGSGSIISASVPVVVAGFTGTPTSGVVPLTVQFANTSVNATKAYLWLFGSGSGLDGGQQASSSTTNPSFTFLTGSRFYTIGLQATGSYTQMAYTSSINYISAAAA